MVATPKAKKQQSLTPYHAKYYAHELSLEHGAGLVRLTQALHDAKVDLNPHQVEAALFALRSPLSKGVLLADEVGLGKTIEAGLVLCQYWAERHRRLIVVCPASLRTQWSQELTEKFFIEARILDAKAFRDFDRQGIDPFQAEDRIIICSFQFAARMKDRIKTIPWNLAVIDEAHNLRNAWRPRNVLGQKIKAAFEGVKKLLLTATPLQNNLIELFGLTSLIDDNIFGEASQFRKDYGSADSDLSDLRKRITPFVQRTLRRQVLEYITYTERKLLTVPFTPSLREQELYDEVSLYLQREDTYGLPGNHRQLTILILRKLLASSSMAIAGTFSTMRERLRALADNGMTRDGTARIALEIPLFDEELWEELIEDEEDDLTEESPVEGTTENDEQYNGGAAKGTTEQRREIDRVALAREITELGKFEAQARSIDVDTKSHALLTALELGFTRMKEMGANEKAVLFTESRRTQDYLKRFLDANGYEGRIVVFNGSNTDAESKTILAEWKTRNTGTDRATGIDRIDIRTALIDRFREKASIFLSTEAGAEGVNLQFASLLINYDLPWNPQRIEQRIGRVHRYGQKFDVVVINFLNSTNQADQRVQELLEEKFALFQGVFGASDEILGSIESGMDFEKRILEIYQTCRTSQAIEEGFNKLRADLDSRIQERMSATRSMLMENFDEDVHERFKGSLLETRALVDRTSAMFWDLSEYILEGRATFHEASRSFMLHQSPTDAIPLGRYTLDRDSPERRYGLGSPLGAFVISQAKGLPVPLAKLTFDIGAHPLRISLVEALSGQSGWLRCSLLVLTRSDSKEEHLVFVGFTDSGHSLDQETMEKLFRVSARAEAIHDAPPSVLQHLAEKLECRNAGILTRVEERQAGFFNEERERLDRWADDQIKSLETELDLAKKRILELRREDRGARTLEEKIHFQGELAALEKRKKRLRMSLFEEEDAINERRDRLIRDMEAQLRQETDAWELYTLRWSVV